MAFLVYWHPASLTPRGQKPLTPLPTGCPRGAVFKIWKDEREQVPLVFLFPIAAVTGKNWTSRT